jgi:hypothetical protein
MAISRGGNERRRWFWEDLQRYGIEYYEGAKK